MTAGETPDLSQVVAAKVAEELAQAERVAPAVSAAWSGNPLGRLVLVKGEPGPAEESGGAALSGADGDAADAALAALGIDPAEAFKTLSRPAPGMASDVERERLVRQIEAVDPDVVVALDPVAAQDVASALGGGSLVAGRPCRMAGRVVVALEGLEASLSDTRLKRRVWAQLKNVSLAEPVW